MEILNYYKQKKTNIMKLEIKKMALVIAVGILALSGVSGQDIREIKLVNKSPDYKVSFLVNDREDDAIMELEGSKKGEEDLSQLEGDMKTIRLIFDSVDGRSAGLDTRQISAIITGSDEQKRTAVKNIEQAIVQALNIRHLGLSANVEVKGNVLVITIQEAATDSSSHPTLGGKLEQLIKK